MSYTRSDYSGYAGIGLILLFILLMLTLVFSGCASRLISPQSWDQANLKRTDHGCPTAIYIAPAGELRQCQELVNRFKIPVQLAPPEFNTIEQAAIAGLKVVAGKPTAPYYEWGGVIVKTLGGKFSALPANTTFSGDSLSIHASDFGLNVKAVGGYHTHPCIPQHDVEYFSEEDLMGSIFDHYTVFMGDYCTGNVHEFKVGDKPDVEHPVGDPGQDAFLTKGRIVGQFTTPHVMEVAE